jgi:peptidoglycan/LPS O-acetylase OafA/YrhL
MSKHAFVTLDGLRGIAAAAIVIRHSPEFFLPLTPKGSSTLLFENYLAVDFFFMLSGFVLTHAYERKLLSGMTPMHFFTVRLIRLYPLYLLALAVAVATSLYDVLKGREPLIRSVINSVFAVAFVPSPISSFELFPLNAPAWSLFFELLANIALAMFIVHLTSRHLGYFLLTTALLLIMSVTFGLFGFDEPDNGAMAAGHFWGSFGAGVLRVSYSFFAGVVLCRIYQAKNFKFTINPIIILSILIIILSCHPSTWLRRPYDLLAVLVIFPFIIIIGASSTSGKHVSFLFSALGLASYAVYVLQVPILNILLIVCYKILGSDGVAHMPIYAGPAVVVFMFTLALACDYFYDVPIRRYLSNWLLLKRNPTADRL